MDLAEKLAAAVAPWAAFPVDAADRPVILVGQPLREAGYLTDEAKRAFAARQLRVANGVPEDAVASMVAVIGVLDVDPEPTVTVISALRVEHEFDTDRGPLLMPAWSLDVTDSVGPIVVLDIAERARLWSASRPEGGSGSAQPLGSDGTRWRYRFFGSPREYTNYVGVDVAASRTAVAIAPRAHELTNGPRATYLQEREVDVALTEPLGARVLVGASGCPITVLGGC